MLFGIFKAMSQPVEPYLDSDDTISMTDFAEVSIAALNSSQFNYK